MQVSFQKEDAKLVVSENKIEITQGFGKIELEIPIFSFKTILLKTFTSGSPQIYGTFDTKLTVAKAGKRYEKLIVKLGTNEQSLNFQFFYNEVAGAMLRMRCLHQNREETLICGEQLAIRRKDDIVEVEDKRIPLTADLKSDEKDFLFGTLLLRTYGVRTDGIFGEIALQGSTLKFPFTALGRKGRMLYPFVTEDAVKLISIL
jgi:hypothetical protein